VVKLHGALAATQLALCDDCPGVRMAEDSGVLLDALVHASDKADVVGGLGECRPEQMDAVGRVQILVDCIHCLATTLCRGGFGNNRPSIALDEDLAFFILVAADLQALGGDTSQVPLTIP